MKELVKSIFAGVLSGVATDFVSIYALGYTNALVMPTWASLAIWQTVVVFGLGAGLVAFAIHLLSLYLLRARASLALVSFFGTALIAMAVMGQLSFGGKTLAAWLVGAFLASLACHKLRPSQDLKLSSESLRAH